MNGAIIKREKTKFSSKAQIIKKDLKYNRYIYLLALPILAYFIIFNYIPMYGVIIAFKDFSPRLGILGSEWIGLEHFKTFFEGTYFWRILRNTLLINVYDLLWGFPAPIILALLLNELRGEHLKRTVQSIVYLPHFISMVVICGLILDFSSSEGIFNIIRGYIGLETVNLLSKPEMFRSLYISTGIWQGIGWGSIIYLAALTGINPQLYEAAVIDGANRWRRIWNITLPGIMPTIIIMLILRIGSMMSIGFEKIILLYNPLIYETADVIGSYVYRKGLLEFSYSYSTAVGLFNSLINFALLVFANKFSKKISEISLW